MIRDKVAGPAMNVSFFRDTNLLRILLLSLFYFFFSPCSKAQFYETGQDPYSISWKQIKTKNYQLIFPEEFESKARMFASSLDSFIPVSSAYLFKTPRPVSVVFHTQSSLSNGLVVYAPKRMELYTIPPQDNDPQDWLDELALHETRHVVQLDALNRGLTKIGYYLAGQQALGAVSGLVPRWFLEGDAVYSETVFSKSGRGRSASFLMPYRTLTQSRKKLFSYEKALLGSYKDFVPDIYQMGYPIVKMMRDSFDRDIFGKSLQFTGRNPYLVFPFGHSLKQNTGLNNRKAYEFTFNKLKDIRGKQKNDYETYTHWPVKKSGTFTNYNLPVLLTDSFLLVQKWSLAETRNYTLVNRQGKERKLITTGSNNSERISVFGNKITWSENKTDLRWQNRTYSEVMVYDLKTKKIKRLTKRTWFFSPAFSPDGKRMAVIGETPGYTSSLVILDASSGEIMKKAPAPDNSHLQYPLWSGNHEIYVLVVNKHGKSIQKLDSSDNWSVILPFTFKNISSYCLAENSLIIAGENNGINNLFIYKPEDDSFYQITRSETGAFEPFFDTNSRKLYFSEYTSKGHRIASIPWEPDSYPVIPEYRQNQITADTLTNNDFNIREITKDTSNYTVKKYSKGSHLLNIHSWLPAYFNYSVSDVTNPAIYPGLLLLSQDVLGTAVSSFGYSYENGFSHLHANISYKALYPIISWSLNVGGPVSHGENAVPQYRKNIQSTVNVSLPLNFSRGRMASGITPYVEWNYNRNAYYLRSEKRYYQGLSTVNLGYNFYWYTKMAVRDIYPRFGISSFFRLRSTPFEKKIYNSIYAFSFRQYLPGLFKNHSFQVRYARQYQSPLNYMFPNLLAYPAGYPSKWTEQMNLVNLMYAFPVFYPDFHAGPIFYLKRIRTNIFYDQAWNRAYNQPNIITHDILRSVGTDLIADIHFLRIMFPFQLGVRLAYLPDKNSFYSQAIFSVNLVY